ncbi:hypothetical protein D3OALGA1CA_1920 [Olavius algarvensis associated proteobacterium Delta 3]|nr:hypothetical protein D3OALGA1CA_1920 [Olavius algarvensis associated proteobacterium Delta 3]CAB5118351.1 hypothetical protein D3OALGB2SA_2813 [Olavius algarvensis associated proteobacterium Delta 3]
MIYSDFQNSVPEPDPTFNRNTFMATAIKRNRAVQIKWRRTQVQRRL